MNEWIKKNNEKVIYGLGILVIVLLISIFSSRNNFSQETARLGNANSALAAESAAKDKEIGEAKEKIDELSKSYDESNAEAEKLAAEIARLNTANSELSDKVTALDTSLTDAGNEIVRLSNAKSALEAESAANSKTITDEREKLNELTRNYDTSLSDANFEIYRLDYVASLRKNKVEDLENQVKVLKQTETESKEVIAKLRVEIEASNTTIKRLEETIKNLGNP